MQKTFYDICPITNKKTYLKVDYIEYSGLAGEHGYSKSRYSCSNNSCISTDCPLYKQAPNNL